MTEDGRGRGVESDKKGNRPWVKKSGPFSKKKTVEKT